MTTAAATSAVTGGGRRGSPSAVTELLCGQTDQMVTVPTWEVSFPVNKLSIAAGTHRSANRLPLESLMPMLEFAANVSASQALTLPWTSYGPPNSSLQSLHVGSDVKNLCVCEKE